MSVQWKLPLFWREEEATLLEVNRMKEEDKQCQSKWGNTVSGKSGQL